jgi:hypothetical protein
MAVIGTCQACELPDVRIAPSTTDCACLVCERCAQMFLDDGVCGVCGTPLPEDEDELLQDEEA